MKYGIQYKRGKNKMVDTTQALANIAKKGKTEVAALQIELDEIMGTMPNTPDRERLALRELNNRYSGPPDKTAKFDICIVGLHQLGDFSRQTMKAAMDAYKKDPEDALERGLVGKHEGEIVPLDIQKTINYGQGDTENKGFGKPLEHSYSRNVVVLAREEGAAECVLTELAMRNDFAKSSLPEMFKTLKCNLLGSIKNGLKTAKTSKFNPSSEDPIDFNGLLNSLAKDKIKSLGDCFADAKTWDKTKPGFYSRYVITEGECKFMNDPKKEGGNLNGTFDSYTTDSMVSAFVDPAAGKPVIGQEYTLIAQTSIKKGYDKETRSSTDEDVLVLNVLGFYQA